MCQAIGNPPGRCTKADADEGSGVPTGIADRVKRTFGGSRLDIILFGHSHVPCNRVLDETLLLNPGRASDSYAVLTVDETVQAEIATV